VGLNFAFAGICTLKIVLSLYLLLWRIRAQVQHMLNYFHRRGKLVYFGGGGATGNSSCGGGGGIGGGIHEDDEELLQRLAVVDCSWFVAKVGRLLTTSQLSSRCTAADAIQVGILGTVLLSELG